MTRNALHLLVDKLPEEELGSAGSSLEYLNHRATEAALEDSEYAAHLLRKIQVADEQISRGETVSLEHIQARFLPR